MPRLRRHGPLPACPRLGRDAQEGVVVTADLRTGRLERLGETERVIALNDPAAWDSRLGGGGRQPLQRVQRVGRPDSLGRDRPERQGADDGDRFTGGVGQGHRHRAVSGASDAYAGRGSAGCEDRGVRPGEGDPAGVLALEEVACGDGMQGGIQECRVQAVPGGSHVFGQLDLGEDLLPSRHAARSPWNAGPYPKPWSANVS